MTEIKKLLIPLTDYPHMSYWATLEEAFVLLNFPHESCYHTVYVSFQHNKCNSKEGAVEVDAPEDRRATSC